MFQESTRPAGTLPLYLSSPDFLCTHSNPIPAGEQDAAMPRGVRSLSTEPPQVVPQYSTKAFRIFGHHEMAGVEFNELSPRNLQLNTVCDRWSGYIVFRADNYKRRGGDLANPSMDVGCGHARERLTQHGAIPSEDALQ